MPRPQRTTPTLPDGFRSGGCAVRFDAEGSGLSPEDRAALRPPHALPDGSTRYDAILARVGVKAYGAVREYTPAAVLEAAAAAMPGTVGFVEPHRVVTPTTAKGLDITARLGPTRYDAARQALIGEIYASAPLDRSGTSVGWVGVVLDDTPGEADGERYDAAWRSATANHFVFTRDPRSKGSHVRLDARDRPMPRITIDGVQHEVEAEVAAAFVAHQRDHQTRLDAVSAERDTAAAKAAALAAEVEALKANRMDAEAVKTLLVARRTLEREAEPFLSDADKLRLDAMGDDDVKRAVVVSAEPTAEKWSDAEIAGAYRLTVARGPVRSDAAPTSTLPAQRASLPSPTGAATPAPIFNLRQCGADYRKGA